MCCFVDTIPGVVECDEGLIPLSHDLNHEFEAVDQPCVAQSSVQGRLRSHSAFWLQELEPSPFVREVISLLLSMHHLWKKPLGSWWRVAVWCAVHRVPCGMQSTECGNQW